MNNQKTTPDSLEKSKPFPDASIDKQLDPTTMPDRSRLKHKLENNSKKTLIFSLLGIAALIALLVFFGVPALVEFVKFTGNREEETAAAEDELVVILPPYIDESVPATNSAEITIHGTSEGGEKVKLYKDSKLVDEAEVDDSNSFQFKDVLLAEGSNAFKAKAFKGNDESRFTDIFTIIYRKEAPELSIDYPSEGQAISNKDGNRLQIEGTTEKDVRVTVNGSQAIVSDSGKFKYVISISGGENTIKVIATDDAGNKTEMERKFTYNP